MEILPLTYDRYFKKVFSHTNITKQFLEDFLNIEIASIELYENKFNVTNSSRELRFDCIGKMDKKHFIVEMQQWYKYDVVKRFYLYHCANTLLQLENLPTRQRLIRNRSTGEFMLKKEKDYSTLVPSITILWFVDDSFKMKNDTISYIVLPESTKNFILNQELWNNNKKLLEERQKIIAQINNNEKEIDFLQENKMIYALQRQILKNDNNKKYYRWFDFAEKTKNKENNKKDFIKYKKDDIFSEIMRLLSVEFVQEEELKIAEDYCDYNEEYLKQVDEDYKRGYSKAEIKFNEIIKDKDEKLKDKEEKIKDKDRILKDKDEKLKDKDEKLKDKDEKLNQLHNVMINSIKNLYKANYTIFDIHKTLDIPEDEIRKHIKN